MNAQPASKWSEAVMFGLPDLDFMHPPALSAPDKDSYVSYPDIAPARHGAIAVCTFDAHDVPQV